MQDVDAAWLIWIHNAIYDEITIGLDPDGDRADVYGYCREHLHYLAEECPEKEINGIDDDVEDDDVEDDDGPGAGGSVYRTR